MLKDETLEQIINLSNKGTALAREKKNNNQVISKELCEEQIKKIEELLPHVLEHNDELAKWYLSEAIMDYTYASGQTENHSMRMR